MDTANRVRELLSRLSAVPPRISGAVAGWTETQLRAKPAISEWSAAEVFAHLRASDDILAHRVHAILVRDNPPLPAFDERRWAEVAGYAAADFRTSFEAFALRRAELVKMLHRAALDNWQRVGAHAERGSISVLDVVTWVVEHEDEHCAQLEALSRKTKRPSS